MFGNNLPGDQPLEVHTAFEEWADPEDRHIAELLEDHTTAEGRVLHLGDVITPRQARAEHVRWKYVDGMKPRWNPRLRRWEVGDGPTEHGIPGRWTP